MAAAPYGSQFCVPETRDVTAPVDEDETMTFPLVPQDSVRLPLANAEGAAVMVIAAATTRLAATRLIFFIVILPGEKLLE